MAKKVERMKPPYFPMYVRDMLSSMWVGQMDAEQFGWYMRMLLRSWDAENPCHIPNDPETIVMFAKADKAAFDTKGWLVLQRFKVTRNGKFIFNTRLLAEYKEVMGSYKKRSSAAQSSWESRAKKSNTDAMHSNADGKQGYTEAEADTEADTKKKEKPSAHKARRATGTPDASQVAKAQGDKRHSRSQQMVEEFYREWAGVVCPWGPAEAGNLGKILREWPGSTDAQFMTCLENIGKSECIPKGTRPCEWLCKLPKFLHGPLDEFWKTKRNGDGSTSKAAEKLNRNRQAIVSGLTGQGDCSNAGHSVPDIQRDRTDGGAGVVLEGSPQRAKSATNS